MSTVKPETPKESVDPNNYLTAKVRFSHAHVIHPHRPKDKPNDPLKYSVCILLDKSDIAEHARWEEAIRNAIRKGIEQSKFTAKQVPMLKMPLRDGDAEVEMEKKKPGQGYEGCWFVNAVAQADKPPTVALVKNRLAVAVTQETEAEFYSGCYGKAIISFYPFKSPQSMGIAVGLNGVMKIADGPRLDGRVDAAGIFGKLAAEIEPEEGESFGEEDAF